MQAVAAHFPELQARLAAADVASNPPRHDADAAEAAGQRGELDVLTQLEAVCSAIPGVSSLTLLRGVRIPDPQQGGHKEIDVVAVSHAGITCIEVKNWSGSVRAVRNGGWEQLRRHHPEPVLHADPVALLRHKALLLQEYLVSRRVELSGLGGIECRLVMPNPNLQLDAGLAAAAREVLVLAPACAAFYETFRQTAHERLAALLFPAWLSRAQLSASAIAEVCRALSAAGTWDTLALSGGASHTGDFIGIEGLPLVDRARVGRLTLTHTRSPMLGGAFALLGWAPSVLVQGWAREAEDASWLSAAVGGVGEAAVTTQRLAIDAALRFRPAGQRSHSRFLLNEVEGVTLSVPLSRAGTSPAVVGQQSSQQRRGRSRSGSPSPAAQRRRTGGEQQEEDWLLVE